MSWFNYYGLAIMAFIMIPNIVFAVKNKDGFENNYHNKTVLLLEQVSRYACFFLMIFNIPYACIGFYFQFAKIVYIIVNFVLVFGYCLVWIITWKRSGIIKSLFLSIIPSFIFIFSGVMLAYIPLVAFSVIFAITHIIISVKNSKHSS